MIDTPIFANLLAWVKVNWLFLSLIAGIAMAFIFLRTTPSKVQNVEELSSLLHDGKPTVFEFYSNF